MQFEIEQVFENIFNKKEQNNWDPTKKIEEVTKEKEQYVLELQQYLSGTDYDLSSLEKDSQELQERSDALLLEIMECKRSVEEEILPEMDSALSEHTEVLHELDSVQYSLDIVNYVVNCKKHIHNYKHYHDKNNILKCVENLNQLYKIINESPEGSEKLAIAASIRKEFDEAKIELAIEVDNAFDRYVYWSKEYIDQAKHISLHIRFEPDHESYSVIEAAFLFDRLNTKLEQFSSFLLKSILQPIMVEECTIHYERNEFNIVIQPNESSKPDYKNVIKHILNILTPISDIFNVHCVDKNTTLMSIVAKQIGDEFADAMMQNCLLDTIPNNVEDMQNYGEVTLRVKAFQASLEGIGFLPPGVYITSYIDRLDELFSEQCSQHFLKTARTIMFKDLSVTMSIGVNEIPHDVTAQHPSTYTEELLQLFDSEISSSLFYFPRCMISKSSQELMDLVLTMLEQSMLCTNDICKNMFLTTRMVFELYEAVVPYHHQEYLHTIPQYVALFHNNCMFLAHNLQLLGDKWESQMVDLDYPISFIDLVPKLQELGQHHLAAHLQQQRKQILDNIRASDLNSMSVKDLLSANAEQAIRQCLRQLQILKNVWIGVFPANVFARLIATLMSVFVGELIHRVCSVEDLSAAMCTQLGEIFTIVLNKAPKCFKNDKDIEKFVRTWPKFQELVMILSATLKEIEARWKGNGPISKCFTITELRSLVKAIFQNSQFRANFLAKLK